MRKCKSPLSRFTYEEHQVCIRTPSLNWNVNSGPLGRPWLPSPTILLTYWPGLVLFVVPFKTGCEILLRFSSMTVFAHSSSLTASVEEELWCHSEAVHDTKCQVTHFCGIAQLSLPSPFTIIVTGFLHRLEQLELFYRLESRDNIRMIWMISSTSEYWWHIV